MNRDLGRIADKADFDIVFVDKGTWLWPETLEKLKTASSMSLALHFTPDPQFKFHRSRHFFKCLPLYDLAVTTKSYELEDYRAGCENGETLFIQQGYSSRILVNESSRSEKDEDVIFIGHREPHYVKCIKASQEVAPRTAVWGAGWPAKANLDGLSKKSVVKGSGIYGPGYSERIAAADIGLGLLSKLAPDVTTTRTFEIPAIGTFMLAERSDEHLSLFEEGKEAEFFSSYDELKEKITFYIGNPAARQKIASAGHDRCMRSGYSTEQQFGKVVDWIKRQVLK
ncbi:glycosyltransferase [Nereida sp. MMG024]|nr:glycosyltransferase [Nereida sp. MMG025]